MNNTLTSITYFASLKHTEHHSVSRHYSELFCTNSLAPHNCRWGRFVLSPFYGGNRGMKKLSNLPKVAQIGNCWAWNPGQSGFRVHSVNHYSLRCFTSQSTHPTAGGSVWSPRPLPPSHLINLPFPLYSSMSFLIPALARAHVDYGSRKQFPASQETLPVDPLRCPWALGK